MARRGYIKSITCLRNKFNVGDKIDISNQRVKEGQCYRLQGRAVVAEKYEDFMVIEKECMLGKLRECISYSDIHAEYVKVIKC